MAITVKWSPEAIDDLENIAEFIARDSRFYAGTVVKKIIKTTRNLKEFPLVGRIVPEIDKHNIRELFVYNYRIVYKIDGNFILITAIIHGKVSSSNFSKRLS